MVGQWTSGGAASAGDAGECGRTLCPAAKTTICSTRKIVLKFDVQQKKVIGDVTHTLTVLKGQHQQAGFRLRWADDSKRAGEQSGGKIREHSDGTDGATGQRREEGRTSSKSKSNTKESPPRAHIFYFAGQGLSPAAERDLDTGGIRGHAVLLADL